MLTFRTKKCSILVFSGKNSKKPLSYLKSTPSNLSDCKVWCKIKILKFETKNALFWYFWAGIWKTCCHIRNQHPQIRLTANLAKKQKCLNLKLKMCDRVFLDWNLKKILSYLKSAPSNWSNCEILWNNENV